MNRAVLKISKPMWDDLKSGIKDSEVRKLNKDYIQEGFQVTFIDERTGNRLGAAIVKSKSYWMPKNAYLIEHKPTRFFVENNYKDEPRIIIFRMEVAK